MKRSDLRKIIIDELKEASNNAVSKPLGRPKGKFSYMKNKEQSWNAKKAYFEYFTEKSTGYEVVKKDILLEQATFSTKDLYGKGGYYFGTIDFYISGLEDADDFDADKEDTYDWKYTNDKRPVQASGNGKTIDVTGNLSVGLFAKGTQSELFDKKSIFHTFQYTQVGGALPCLVPNGQIKNFEVEENQHGTWIYQKVKKVIIPVSVFKKGSPSFQVSPSGFKFSLSQNELDILREL